MSSHIVHFGTDEHGVLAVLTANGYAVHECGTSVASFNDVLSSNELDAVVVQPGTAPIRDEIVIAALSQRSLPWVLFQEMDYPRGADAFDLVVPRGMLCSAWLEKIERLIKRSQELQSDAKLICERAASLQQTAQSATQNSILGKVEGEYRRRSRAARSPKQVTPSFKARQPKTSILAQPKIRILVVDDQDSWRRMMCRILGYNRGLQVIAEAADGAQAVEIVGRLRPDMVLLDIHMPGTSGLEAAKQIMYVNPSTKIIVLTSATDAELVRAAFVAGAIGYVLKTDAGRELDNAIEAAFQGRGFVSSGLGR